MAHKRKSDLKVNAWYRTDRMLEYDGLWYFHTREKTIEGPLHSEHDAQSRLKTYISLYNSGVLSNEEKLSLGHFELQKTA